MIKTDMYRQILTNSYYIPIIIDREYAENTKNVTGKVFFWKKIFRAMETMYGSVFTSEGSMELVVMGNRTLCAAKFVIYWGFFEGYE